jgi:hypothetical protein
MYNFENMANDHFVSDFYLRQFSPYGQPGLIYVYRKDCAPELEPIKKTACADDYYAKSVDRKLSRSEISSAEILKRLIIDSPSLLSQDDRQRLAYFIGLLANRTPRSQQHLHSGHATVAASLEEYCSDREFFFHSEKQKGYTGTDEELELRRLAYIEGAKESHIQFQPTKSNDELMKIAFELAQDTARILEVRQWHILESTTSRVFVTCDNPVVIIQTDHQSRQLQRWLRNGSVLLPLSPGRTLLIDEVRGNSVFEVSRQDVDRINNCVIANAYMEVYSNWHSKDIANTVNRIKLAN